MEVYFQLFDPEDEPSYLIKIKNLGLTHSCLTVMF
jgi:hypothetical protein